MSAIFDSGGVSRLCKWYSSAAHISLRQGCISPVLLSDASFPTASIRHLSSFGLPLMAFFSFAAQLAKSVSDTTVWDYLTSLTLQWYRVATGHTIHYIVDAPFVVCDKFDLFYGLLHFFLRRLMFMASVFLRIAAARCWDHLCCSYPAVAMVNTNMVANRGISSLHTIHRDNQSFILLSILQQIHYAHPCHSGYGEHQYGGK